MLGVCLVLVGQMISAVQFIVEETFLSKRDCDPLQVIFFSVAQENGAFVCTPTLVSFAILWYIEWHREVHWN